ESDICTEALVELRDIRRFSNLYVKRHWTQGSSVMNLASCLLDVSLRQPDLPAVTDRRTRWSYREFVRRSARIAGTFQSMGLGHGERIAICMENCAEFLEIQFACWTAGLCTVPINAKLHAREIEHIVRDCGAHIIVTTPNLAGALARLC